MTSSSRHLGREHRHLVLGIDVAQAEAQRETVELRLGQGIRARRFHRILRGDDEEGIGKRPPHALRGDLSLGHRLEERRLRARARPVDLVGEQDIAEHRPVVEVERLVARIEGGHADDVGGQQIGGELHPLEVGRERQRERVGERGLSGARHVLEEHVSAGRVGREEPAQCRGTSKDHPRKIRAEVAEQLP
jgi:hypothetical protein